jgi:hypothetical protein
MRTLGFTGSRELLYEEEVEVEQILYTLNGDGVVTGACIGLDEFVAKWFATNRPHMKQIIYVPGDRSRVNMAFVDAMEILPQVSVVFMPKNSSYAERNLAIVASCEILLGFPRERESHPNSRRSGTWQTIRKGRLANKTVHVHILTELVGGPLGAI